MSTGELLPALTEMCLCFLIDERPDRKRVLLGEKLTGFGAGNVVGLGGHVDAGEDARTAAVREVREESGIVLDRATLDHAATVVFRFPARPSWDQIVEVFTAAVWQGESSPSDEIRPQWYDLAALPLADMWDDASYWLPLVLGGRRIRAEVSFADDNRTVSEARLSPIG